LAAATPRLKTKGWALGKPAILAASEVIFVLALHRYDVQREGILWSRCQRLQMQCKLRVLVLGGLLEVRQSESGSSGATTLILKQL
jgi:hypothetical protein